MARVPAAGWRHDPQSPGVVQRPGCTRRGHITAAEGPKCRPDFLRGGGHPPARPGGGPRVLCALRPQALRRRGIPSRSGTGNAPGERLRCGRRLGAGRAGRPATGPPLPLSASRIRPAQRGLGPGRRRCRRRGEDASPGLPGGVCLRRPGGQLRRWKAASGRGSVDHGGARAGQSPRARSARRGAGGTGALPEQGGDPGVCGRRPGPVHAFRRSLLSRSGDPGSPDFRSPRTTETATIRRA